MRCLLFLLLAVGFAALPVRAAAPIAEADSSLASVLNFEADQPAAYPAGWGGGPPETNFVDNAIVHAGSAAARIERTPASPESFSSLTRGVRIAFSGRRLELRGWIRTENVTEFAGLWMREDGPGSTLEFDNMQSRQLKGTTDWTEYSISLPLNPTARRLYFGFLVAGTGKGWVDDLQLLVDGKPVWEAPKISLPETALDRDHAFDAGSKLAFATLTPLQTANLATLGRVWGFLKYHHPKVTSGAVHWDYELFRILPAVLAAVDASSAHAALVEWIDRLGPIEPGERPPLPSDKLALLPDLRWIDVDGGPGSALSARLRDLQATQPAGQFYVSLVRGVGNPAFENEPDYPAIKLPDPGYQLLGLFRYWNVIRYWFPYRDLITDNWDATLTEFIPRLALAKNADAYQLEMMALIAKVGDTHANLWSSLHVRPPVGNAELPIAVRCIEDRFVVTDVLPVSTGEASPFRRGDILAAFDDTPVADLVRRWTPYYAASNEPTRLRDIARSLTRGPIGPVQVQIERDGAALTLAARRVPTSSLPAPAVTHDLPGPAFRLLSPRVAYLKLSTVKLDDIPAYLRQAVGTDGWIIDIRNYPAAFVVFALGGQFVDHRTDFARFSTGSLENPGAFSYTESVAVGSSSDLDPLVKHPDSPALLAKPTFTVPAESVTWSPPNRAAYPGRIVVLVDEVSQSNAEYTAMAFRAAPRTVVIGSTTAGADGNVSGIPLPGGLHTMISGIGVFYPDKRPTQRVGIIPDLGVKPTVAGIRAGRDEVLEAALHRILGPNVPADEIARLAPPLLQSP